MKREHLKELTENINQTIPMIYKNIKQKYPYLFRKSLFIDNFRLNTYKSVITHVISSMPNNSNDILLELLVEQLQDDIKIIKINGTTGQDYIAYLLTEYIKLYSKKVTLLSSLSFYNPMTRMASNMYTDDHLKSEDYVLAFIKASVDYNTEYIILENNNTHILDNIPCDIDYTIKPYSKQDFKNLLDTLNIYDEELFNKVLSEVTVPSASIIYANDRTIVITKDYTTIESYLADEDNIWNANINWDNITIMINPETNRIQSIRTLIEESNPGDTLFITGRGAEKLYKEGNLTKIFTDEQIVRKKLEELQWL